MRVIDSGVERQIVATNAVLQITQRATGPEVWIKSYWSNIEDIRVCNSEKETSGGTLGIQM